MALPASVMSLLTQDLGEEGKKKKKPRKPLHTYPEAEGPRSMGLGASLNAHWGLDSLRLHSLVALSDGNAIAACGNTLLFLDLAAHKIEVVPGAPRGGIGAICRHPKRSVYVVCEKSDREAALAAANPPASPAVGAGGSPASGGGGSPATKAQAAAAAAAAARELEESAANAVQPAKIRIYEYPSRRLLQTLVPNPEVRGFSVCKFNPAGDLLATVAIEPDFTLTLWNWEKGEIVLRNKASGNDVFSISFSSYNPGALNTSGLGHIRFWTMAETFTGLKLKGNVGRFGRVDICDVTAAVQLPDGKVLSGSETGHLLLWEGGMIKCQFARKRLFAGPQSERGGMLAASTFGAGMSAPASTLNSPQAGGAGASTLKHPAASGMDHHPHSEVLSSDGGGSTHSAQTQAGTAADAAAASSALTVPSDTTRSSAGATANTAELYMDQQAGHSIIKCHEGRIDFVDLIEDGAYFITAGADGYIRYWPFQDIDLTEATGGLELSFVLCLREVFLGDNVSVRCMSLTPSRSFWVILDANGSVRRVPYESKMTIAATITPCTPPPPPGSSVEISKPLVEAQHKYFEFASGPLLCIASHPSKHLCVTGGHGGSLRLTDYTSMRTLYETRIAGCNVNCVRFMPGDATHRIIVVGCSDGTVRTFRLCTDKFEVISQERPHSEPVIDFAIDPAGKQLYSFSLLSEDERKQQRDTIKNNNKAQLQQKKEEGGEEQQQAQKGDDNKSKKNGAASNGAGASLEMIATAFYMTFDHGPQTGELTPHGFCRLPLRPSTCEWDAAGTTCLVGAPTSEIIALEPPAKDKIVDFEFAGQWNAVAVRQKKKRPPKQKKHGKGGKAGGGDDDFDNMAALDMMALAGKGEESSSDEDDDDEQADQGPWGVNHICRIPAAAVQVPDVPVDPISSPTKSSDGIGRSDDDDEDDAVGAAARQAERLQERDAAIAARNRALLPGVAIAFNQPELCYEYKTTLRYGDNATRQPPLPKTGLEPPNWVEEPLRNFAHRNTVVRRTVFSASGKVMVSVCDSARVLIRPAMPNEESPEIGFAAQLHDSLHGVVHGAAVSFDDSLVLSVGEEGAIFSQLLRDRALAPKSTPVSLSDWQTAVSSGPPAPIALSIQAQKFKDDADRAAEAALTARERLMKRISAVHSDFAAILAANDAETGGRRLSHEELSLSELVADKLGQRLNERVADAKKEFNWVSKKKLQQLQKLQAKYIDILETDSFCVRPFDSSRGVVCSFRTSVMTATQKKHLDAIQQLLSEDEKQNLREPYQAQQQHQKDSGDGRSDAHELSVRDSTSRNSPIQQQQSPQQQQQQQQQQQHHPDDNEDTLNADAVAAAAAAAATADSYCANNNNNNNNKGSVVIHESAEEQQHRQGGTTNGGLRTTANSSKLNTSSRVNSQLEAAEERRREREDRRAALLELDRQNPKSLPEDPAVTHAIQRAKRKMGDYVLKQSDDFKVPDHLRPTADRKAKALALLEHSANQVREVFNTQLLEMRDRKRRLVKQLNQDRQRVVEVCALLKVECDIAEFKLERDEMPEDQFTFDNETMLAWEAARAKEAARKAAEEKAKRGFGSDLATGQADADDKKKGGGGGGGHHHGKDGESADKSSSAAAAAAGGRGGGPLGGGARGGTVFTPKEKFEQDLRLRLEGLRRSELEIEESLIQRERLLFERNKLTRKIQKDVRDFDSELRDLLRKRTSIQSDLLMADMRSLLIFNEYLKLINFRLQDSALAERLEVSRHEKMELVHQSRLCSERVQVKKRDKADLRRTGETLKMRFQQMLQHAPDSAKDALEYIFWKRIKPKDEAEEDNDDVTSSEELEDEVDDKYADDGEPDVRPDEVDAELFQAILDLRVERLACEQEMKGLTKIATELNAQHNDLVQREAAADEKLAAVERDIAAFQNQKQRELNALDTVVVLKMSQIQCLKMPSKELPANLDHPSIVVFDRRNLERLVSRIGELDREKEELQRRHNLLHAHKSQAGRRRTRQLAEKSAWEMKVYELQLLKFGQRVDLELLENIAVDRESEELKAQLKMEEIFWEREVAKQDERLLEFRQGHQQKIAENTSHLKELGGLRAEQYEIEQDLAQSLDRVVSKMSGGSKVATVEDRQRLRDLIVAQQRDIDALKAEVAMLRRKGGYVYTPVVNQVQAQIAAPPAAAAAAAAAAGSDAYARGPPASA